MSDNSEHAYKKMLSELKALNEFIRQLEDFANENNVNIETDKIYLVACSQRSLIRKILS